MISQGLIKGIMISQALINDIEEFLTKITHYTNNLTGNEGLKTILANLNEAGIRKYSILSLKVHVEYQKENISRLERGYPPITISTRQGYIEVAKVYKFIRKRNYNDYVKHKRLSKTFTTSNTRRILAWSNKTMVLGIPVNGSYSFKRILECTLQYSVAEKLIKKGYDLDKATTSTKEEMDKLIQESIKDIFKWLESD